MQKNSMYLNDDIEGENELDDTYEKKIRDMQRHLRDQVRGGSQIMEEEDVMDAADIMREDLG